MSKLRTVTNKWSEEKYINLDDYIRVLLEQNMELRIAGRDDAAKVVEGLVMNLRDMEENWGKGK